MKATETSPTTKKTKFEKSTNRKYQQIEQNESEFSIWKWEQWFHIGLRLDTIAIKTTNTQKHILFFVIFLRTNSGFTCVCSNCFTKRKYDWMFFFRPKRKQFYGVRKTNKLIAVPFFLPFYIRWFAVFFLHWMCYRNILCILIIHTEHWESKVKDRRTHTSSVTD